MIIGFHKRDYAVEQNVCGEGLPNHVYRQVPSTNLGEFPRAPTCLPWIRWFAPSPAVDVLRTFNYPGLTTVLGWLRLSRLSRDLLEPAWTKSGSSPRFVFGVWRGPQAPRKLGACPTGPREELDPPLWRPRVRFFAVSPQRGAVGTE